jgi:cell division transport system ATP-binding protein
VIDFSHVTKTFPTGESVLKDITFTINPGEFVCITGKSGVGKTTLGRLLIHDLVPTKGEIKVDGEDLSKINSKDIPRLRRKIGFVFQDYKIIPDKTVAENITYALEIAGYDRTKIEPRIAELLSLVGIPGEGDLFPLQLSGGELQRASIARAIAADPPILFADEPTGNLDKETSIEIFNLLKKINETGTTVIMATHDVTIINFNHARHIHLEQGEIAFDKDNMKKDTFEDEESHEKEHNNKKAKK